MEGTAAWFYRGREEDSVSGFCFEVSSWPLVMDTWMHLVGVWKETFRTAYC